MFGLATVLIPRQSPHVNIGPNYSLKTRTVLIIVLEGLQRIKDMHV